MQFYRRCRLLVSLPNSLLLTIRWPTTASFLVSLRTQPEILVFGDIVQRPAYLIIDAMVYSTRKGFGDIGFRCIP